MGGLAIRIGTAERSARPRETAPDFRDLLGEAAWVDLPAAVRARFEPCAHRQARAYPGAMQVRCSWAGWLIAQVCRLAGTPIAPGRGRDVPVTVTVRPAADGSLLWERLYAFAGRKPVRVTSRKLIGSDGALLEVAPGGIAMRLALSVEDSALVFRSTGYGLKIGRRLLPLPSLLTPGVARAVHRDEGGGRFFFGMTFVHPLLGETFSHAGYFQDPQP
ncbi:MAG: DUF4166 domain-containing protein [Caulobacterales bacterium]